MNEQLILRCFSMIAYAVHKHGGGYTSEGKPAGDEKGWEGVTQLMDDLKTEVAKQEPWSCWWDV